MKSDLLEPVLEVVPPPPPRRLSTDLRELLELTNGRSLSLGELEEIMQGRGFALFILLMSLPFASPIPLPGLSVPFGIVILLMGLRIAMGARPSLPTFILRRQVSYKLLEKIVRFGLRVFGAMEKVIKPRMHFLQRWPGMINLIGAAIASGGLLLAAMPPIVPLTNTIPAIAVIFLTMGMIERDGLLVLLGHFVNLLAWAYFIAAFFFGREGLMFLSRWIGLGS